MFSVTPLVSTTFTESSPCTLPSVTRRAMVMFWLLIGYCANRCVMGLMNTKRPAGTCSTA